MKNKVVLAFSGGRGTIAALHILKRRFGRNVITYTANLGQESSTDGLCERAISLGAASAHIADLRARFLAHYIWPAIRAGAVCESGYALAHADAGEIRDLSYDDGAGTTAHVDTATVTDGDVTDGSDPARPMTYGDGL